MNVIGFSGLARSVPFKRREFPGLSPRQYLIAQGFDAAACLATPQGIVAAAAEERFTRQKGTGAFPVHAMRYCLEAGKLNPREIHAVAHGFAYESWKTLFEGDDYGRRLYEEVYSPEVQQSLLKEHFGDAGWDEKLVSVPHHLAHAASAFYPSGFGEALILVSDGMGEAQSMTAAVGDGSNISVLKEISAFHSLGTLYGVITLYLGFHMNSDEYKVMGLAPYGNQRRFFRQMMEFVRLKDDGTYAVPVFSHNHTLEERETHSGMMRMLCELFGPEREPEAEITQTHKDIAAALQAVLESCQLHVLRHFRNQTGQRNLCLAGGVALNCAANGVIRRSRLFDRMFVQPAAGDDGTALGAALYVRQRQDPAGRHRRMALPLWGPEYQDDGIRQALAERQDCETANGVAGQHFDALCRDVAARIAEGQIVAWFQGRMEFGPRALGSRSILADPRDPAMRDKINALVKKREGFRPFAPVVTREAAARIFEITPGEEDAYAHMLYVTRVRPEYRDKLPATTHVDGSARVQTVSQGDNPKLWQLLKEFEKLTGLPVLLNTSFNVRGQPIVCTPREAIDTFRTANLDVLVAGDLLILPRVNVEPTPPPVENGKTQADTPIRCIHEFFEAQAARTPESVAVVYEDRQLTYAGLEARANRLAHHLRKFGVGPEVLVGICMEVSLDLVVAMLAVLKAGGAYVPLDPDYPRERLEHMIRDAQLPVILTQESLSTMFGQSSIRDKLARDGQTALPQQTENGEWRTENKEEVRGEGLLHSAARNGDGAQPTAFICLDAEWSRIEKESPLKPYSGATPDNLAYVIYTSGSTGKPKGVMVAHRNVANFFIGMDACIGAEPPGVWMSVTSISFDISVLELFWTLARGFKVVLAQQALMKARTHKSRVANTSQAIDFSLFYFASNESAAGSDKYRLLLEGARFADEHGFAAVWTPERHFHAFGGLYPNPSITSAAVAAITRRVQIRAGSVVLPLHNPIRVAEEWAVVDNLSGGRVGISFASGWQVNDFVLAPENYSRRKEIMAAQIELLRRLWRGEAVLFPGAEGDSVQVKILPRPVQAELPLWLTSSGNPETFRQAGEMGANLLTHLLGQNLEELARKIALYRAAWKEHGHPGHGRVALMLHTFVGDSVAEVKEIVRNPLLNYLRSSIDLLKNRPSAFLPAKRPTEADVGERGPASFTEEELDLMSGHAFERYFENSGMFGDPELCLERVAQARAIGVDELACLIDFGINADTVLAGLGRLDEVRQRGNSAARSHAMDYSLAAQMARHGATHLQCTPSLAAILAEDGQALAALRSLKKLLLGGEALPPGLLRKLDVPCEVHNMYGPTETTIWSTTCLVDKDSQTVPIGSPIANTEVYIVDESLQPIPAGSAGELLIGGAGVVRGYLDRPELTAQRFVANPFAAGRLYRTGDLVRCLPDGNIEFLGRLDQQVKLRGHRIELGEIEAVLEQHPDIKGCAAVVREDTPGDKRLIAYFVPAAGQSPHPEGLRAWMQRSLPEYMVPSGLVPLEALPLTPNGKLDRKALPRLDSSRISNLKSEISNSQGDGLYNVVAPIWRGVLGVKEAVPRDNFFELGGNSILATQLVSRLRAALKWEVPLRFAFEHPTLEGLTKTLAEAAASNGSARGHERIMRRADREAYPPSFAQRRLWFLNQLEPGPQFNDHFGLRLSGPLNVPALERALNEIVRRHDSLRAVFGNVEGQPVQTILPQLTLSLPVIDLSESDSTVREEAAATRAAELGRQLFRLDQGPLVRASLLRLDPEQHVLLLTFHHIVVDGWSRGVLLRELLALYAAFSEGRSSPLAKLEIQYADYAAWQDEHWLKDPARESSLAYWKKQLRGAPEVLELPADRPRPAAQTYRGARRPIWMERHLFERLSAVGRREGCTPFMVLLAAFQVLLARQSGRTDILVGSPVANRSHPETEPLIGYFLNLLVLRGDLSGDPPFKELLARVREGALAAYAHHDLPFEKLVAELRPARALSHSPLFQAMFILQNSTQADASAAGVKFRPFEFDPGVSKVDLTLNLEETSAGCSGWLEYATDLFDAARVERLAADFQSLLEAIAARPTERLSQLTVPADSSPLLPPLDIAPRINGNGPVGLSSRYGTPLHPAERGNGNGKVAEADFQLDDRKRKGTLPLSPTPLETKLVQIWSEVLHRENVGPHDSLFDLGGHSLLITMIISRIRRVFGLEMPIQILFESPTVAASAAWIEAQLKAVAPVSAPAKNPNSL